MNARDKLKEHEPFRRRLKELREAKGWTFAKLGREADMNTETVRRIELGMVSPSLYSVQKLADAFGIAITTLVRT